MCVEFGERKKEKAKGRIFVELLSDKGSALDLKQRPARSQKANDALTRVCVLDIYCRIETAEGKSDPRRMGGYAPLFYIHTSWLNVADLVWGKRVIRAHSWWQDMENANATE